MALQKILPHDLTIATRAKAALEGLDVEVEVGRQLNQKLACEDALILTLTMLVDGVVIGPEGPLFVGALGSFRRQDGFGTDPWKMAILEPDETCPPIGELKLTSRVSGEILAERSLEIGELLDQDRGVPCAPGFPIRVERRPGRTLANRFGLGSRPKDLVGKARRSQGGHSCQAEDQETPPLLSGLIFGACALAASRSPLAHRRPSFR